MQKGVDVINYANMDRVNGPAVGVSGAAGNTSFSLFALPAPGTGPTAASKLLVGPKAFLANAPAAVAAQQLKAPNGNYRVVAVGTTVEPFSCLCGATCSRAACNCLCSVHRVCAAG